MALVQVFRGMNVIIFNRCAVPKGAQYKERLTDVSWITPLLWTQSNFRSVAGAKEIDIAATLEHLRDQRAGMVQTKVRFPQLWVREVGGGGGGGGRGEGSREGGRRRGCSHSKDDCLLHVHRIGGNDVVIDNCFRIRKTLSWKIITHCFTFITRHREADQDLLLQEQSLTLRHFKMFSLFLSLKQTL